ncbi:OmpA family protein [Roseobacter sp.]|uniref:OmpA family protein n=1 Tax=Roseobacter sp. TaxID=1907202 RepID=UPI0025D88CEB|nr:OmpA family protein [Roseobacter sp.]
MTKAFRSSTAISLCLVLLVPQHGIAQSAEGSFPCVAPGGEEVTDATALSQALTEYMTADKEKGGKDKDLTCDNAALTAAIAAGGAPLATVIAEAPANRQAALKNAMKDAPAQASEAAPVAEAVPEAATETPAEATASDETAPAAETPPVAEAPAAAEQAPAAEAEAVAVAPAEEAPAENAEQPAESEVAAEEAPAPAETITEAAPAEEPVKQSPAETAEAAPETPAETPQTAEAATPAPAAVEETPAEAPVEVGEAGGEQLSDEERQARAQARADEAAPAAAAAAAATDDSEVMAEAETETVTEADVRTSDEDFDTTVSGSAAASAAAAPAATAPAADKDDGLSKFEKALVLGLGAAVVGSLLNNGDQVVSNSGDRVVVERDGELKVLKNDNELLRRPGAEVQTQTFQDGSARTVVNYEDGSQIITVQAADGSVLRRSLIRAEDGREVVLFDDTASVQPVNFSELPTLEQVQPQQTNVALTDRLALEEALRRSLTTDVNRTFSLQQVREYKRVRALAPQIELSNVTFRTGSAAIDASQAEALADLGIAIRSIVREDPSAVFLIEGHTDAVGSASSNLALSDRRAETVALALTEYFGVPPQNLITQGYGETDLKIRVLSDERANRRAAVRNITGLLN